MRDLIQRKNELLQEIERCKATHDRLAVVRLSNDAAGLEGDIAEKLIQAGRLEDAVVNLISRASCLVDAGEARLARHALQQAEYFIRNPKTFEWVLKELDRIDGAQSNRDPQWDEATQRLEALAAAATLELAEQEIRAELCTYLPQYWRRAKEFPLVDLPGVEAEIVCPRCQYEIPEREQRTKLPQGVVCRSCGNNVSG